MNYQNQVTQNIFPFKPRDPQINISDNISQYKNHNILRSQIIRFEAKFKRNLKQKEKEIIKYKLDPKQNNQT